MSEIIIDSKRNKQADNKFWQGFGAAALVASGVLGFAGAHHHVPHNEGLNSVYISDTHIADINGLDGFRLETFSLSGLSLVVGVGAILASRAYEIVEREPDS